MTCLSPLGWALLTGCVSYTAMEFRGTTVNLDGDGQIESGPRELGSQKSGTIDKSQFFALGFGENSEFRLLHPPGKSLANVNSHDVRALLIRGPSRPSSATPAADSKSAHSLTEIELTGPIRIRFRDNNHFNFGVNLKSPGTNNVTVHGEFLAYSVRQFEPMTYIATVPLLFGFGEASFGPARVKTREGNLNLVRRAIAKLSKKRNPGASVEIHIVEANRWITFTKNSVLDNPIGIRFSFPVNSNQDAVLKTRMASVCLDMGLNLKIEASRELSNPTVETEPYFLSVDLCGKTDDVTKMIVKILRVVFDVTDQSLFRMNV